MNILLTSVGRRTYLVDYFKKALEGKGKVFASNSVLTYTMQKADGLVVTPNIYDNDYISFLIDFCKSQKISAIIPLFDIDLPILAKNKELFSINNIFVVVSDTNVTSICNDKWQTYLFLKQLGLKQPKTFISIAETQRALSQGLIKYPLFIKPRWGMGSIGIYKIEVEEELLVFYNRLQREIFNTYLKYESLIDPNSCIIVQESLSGQEYGIEVLNDLCKNYVSTFSKRKIAMRSGETDIAESISCGMFENISHIISKELGHIGILDIDCFVDENNDICILEMNSRFGGQYPFSHNAGVNVPKQIIEWLNGNPTNPRLVTQIDGVRSCKDILPVIMMASNSVGG